MPTNGNYWTSYEGTHGSRGAADDKDGYYYTWDAAMNVCPSGWSLPTDGDWTILENYLGTTVGSSNFDAKLAGYRSTSGSFNHRGDSAYLWSSTESGDGVYRRILSTSYTTVYRDTINKLYGFSVRCIKD